MNVTVALLLAPLALWVMPIHVPPGVNATVVAHLPQICNATGTAFLKGPATYTITCTNPTMSPVPLRGTISVWYTASSQVHGVGMPQQTSLLPWLVMAGMALAAGIGAALERRAELAASLLAVVGRIKRATAEAPVRRRLIKAIEESGAVTMAQLARRLGMSWGQLQWHLYVLEREGKVKSVRVGPFTYYFVDPKAAAEVILSSVDPSVLTAEDREKLDFMARL